MIKIRTFLIALLVPLCSLAIPAPEAVTTFYDGMKELSTATADRAYELRTRMAECFDANDMTGLELPNDFKWFKFDERSMSHNDKVQTSRNYVSKIVNYVFEQKILTVSYRIVSNENAGHVPEFSKSGEAWLNASTMSVVEKTFSARDGYKRVFKDTVFTYLTNGKIIEIRNGHGALGKGTVSQMKLKVAMAYERKQYAEAYRIYQEILIENTSDYEVKYYLALMTYWGRGCKKNKKEAIRSMENVRWFGEGHWKEKAGPVLDFWTNRQAIF